MLLISLVFSCLAPGQSAFVRQTSPNGVCLFWRTRSLVLVLDSAGNAETTGNTELGAIERAAASWQLAAAGCSDLSLSAAGRTATPRVEYLSGQANQNTVVFRTKLCSDVVPVGAPCLADDSCGNAYNCWSHASAAVAVPTTTYDPTTGEILDSDLEFNAANFIFTTVDSPVCQAPNFNQSCVATDVQNAATHQLGLMLGIATNFDPASTMSAASAPGELSKRTIDSATRGGLCRMYPAGLPATQCDGGFVAALDAGQTGSDAGTASTDAGTASTDAGTVSTDGGSSSAAGGGTGASVCGPSNCAGCCAIDGKCELGTSSVACGTAGAICSGCGSQLECVAAQCAVPKRGCGCNSGADLLLVAVLALLAVARKRT
jgi:hypothetical protein